MGKFALAYADQAERDHTALKAAVRDAGFCHVALCPQSPARPPKRHRQHCHDQVGRRLWSLS
jgi:hypothetical protein